MKAAAFAVAGALAVGVVIGIGVDRAMRPSARTESVAPIESRTSSVSTLAGPDPSTSILDATAIPVDAIDDARVAHAALPRPDASTRPPADAPDVASVPGVDAEAQTIVQARNALAQGHVDDALRALMSHERRFPTGQLAEERDVLLVEAYLAAGRLSIVRDRIAAYRRDHPHGIHAARIDTAEAELARRAP